ncbi:MAG: GGDEF domain-containing protein [Labrenzia sp.]
MISTVVIGLVQALALLTLLSFLYGAINRSPFPVVAQRMSIGIVMGIGAVFAMSAPTTIGPGLQIDGRTVFVGVAAAFGGWIPAVITTIIAGFYRLWIGGIGAYAGATGIVIAAAVGLVWHFKTPEKQRGNWRYLLALGALLPLSLIATLLLPIAIALKVSTTLLPTLLPYSLVSTLIFGILLHREHKLVRTERRLEEAANSDFLTGLLNRRAFTHLVKTTESRSHTSTLVVLDIDHFKKINDTLGHAVGDIALAQFGQLLSQLCRGSDVVARLGGEEFGVFMPNTSADQANIALERILKATRELDIIAEGKTFSMTTSAGAFEYDPGSTAFEDALNEADKALYQAKASGRDRSVLKIATQSAA